LNQPLEKHLSANKLYLNFRWRKFKRALSVGIILIILAILSLIAGPLLISTDLTAGIILIIVGAFCIALAIRFFISFSQGYKAYRDIFSLLQNDKEEQLLVNLQDKTSQSMYEQQKTFFSLFALVDLNSDKLVDILTVLIQQARQENRNTKILLEAAGVLARKRRTTVQQLLAVDLEEKNKQ
jgi:hypothetical protein